MASKVCDGIWVGDAEIAQDWNFMEEQRITHIINCAAREVPNMWEAEGISYMSLAWEDRDTQILFDLNHGTLRPLPEIAKFLTQCQEQNMCCLVHSVNGRSRAPACVIAYFMYRYHWNAADSLNFFRLFCPTARPNPGFWSQLMTLQRTLGCTTNSWTQATIPSWASTSHEEERLLQNTYFNSQPQVHIPLTPEEIAEKQARQSGRSLRWIDEDGPSLQRRRSASNRGGGYSQQSTEDDNLLERPPNSCYSSLQAGNGWVDLERPPNFDEETEEEYEEVFEEESEREEDSSAPEEVQRVNVKVTISSVPPEVDLREAETTGDYTSESSFDGRDGNSLEGYSSEEQHDRGHHIVRRESANSPDFHNETLALKQKGEERRSPKMESDSEAEEGKDTFESRSLVSCHSSVAFEMDDEEDPPLKDRRGTSALLLGKGRDENEEEVEISFAQSASSSFASLSALQTILDQEKAAGGQKKEQDAERDNESMSEGESRCSRAALSLHECVSVHSLASQDEHMSVQSREETSADDEEALEIPARREAQQKEDGDSQQPPIHRTVLMLEGASDEDSVSRQAEDSEAEREDSYVFGENSREQEDTDQEEETDVESTPYDYVVSVTPQQPPAGTSHPFLHKTPASSRKDSLDLARERKHHEEQEEDQEPNYPSNSAPASAVRGINSLKSLRRSTPSPSPLSVTGREREKDFALAASQRSIDASRQAQDKLTRVLHLAGTGTSPISSGHHLESEHFEQLDEDEPSDNDFANANSRGIRRGPATIGSVLQQQEEMEKAMRERRRQTAVVEEDGVDHRVKDVDAQSISSQISSSSSLSAGEGERRRRGRSDGQGPKKNKKNTLSPFEKFLGASVNDFLSSRERPKESTASIEKRLSKKEREIALARQRQQTIASSSLREENDRQKKGSLSPTKAIVNFFSKLPSSGKKQGSEAKAETGRGNGVGRGHQGQGNAYSHSMVSSSSVNPSLYPAGRTYSQSSERNNSAEREPFMDDVSSVASSSSSRSSTQVRALGGTTIAFSTGERRKFVGSPASTSSSRGHTFRSNSVSDSAPALGVSRKQAPLGTPQGLNGGGKNFLQSHAMKSKAIVNPGVALTGVSTVSRGHKQSPLLQGKNSGDSRRRVSDDNYHQLSPQIFLHANSCQLHAR